MGWFGHPAMGAIHSNTVGLYHNNNKKSPNIHHQKTLNITLNHNANLTPRPIDGDLTKILGLQARHLSHIISCRIISVLKMQW